MSEQNIQPVRGTHDLWGEEYRKHQWIGQVATLCAHHYGYEPIATPLFEYTSIFKRGIGEATDIVGKEMYTFQDRGGESLTLRPEGTAGVARAIISNGLTQSLPLKFIYNGPMMRYERPQKGRTRQFHQLGVECLGIVDPLVDAETIALGAQILEELCILHRTTLEINTIGDLESRQAYRKALIDYFTPHEAHLSEDSQIRLQKNPLRILDSKSPQDQEIVANAPLFDHYLNEQSQEIFQKVCKGLESLGISYKRNTRLVRGIDYYCHTAFEFTTTDLGTQGAILAGGRYDGLIAQLGGPEIPGVGWAMGIDRIALMLSAIPPQSRPIAIISMGEETLETAFQLSMKLRQQALPIEFPYSGNMGKKMKRANKVNACAAIIVGTDEIATQKATVRNLDTGEQNIVAFEKLNAYLKETFY